MIWAESRVGKETRFTFIIPKTPLQEGARLEAERRAPAPERPEANQTSVEKETDRHPIPSHREQLDELIYGLSKAEEEGEVGIYLLRLHLENDVDLRFFKPKEREEIKKQLSFLIDETARHRELLAAAIEEMRQRRESDAR